LDDKDPARRKVDTLTNEGNFIVSFGKNEQSRWVWGQFDKSNVRFSLWLTDQGKMIERERMFSSINLYISQQFEIDTIFKLFYIGCEHLGAFYAYCDLSDVIRDKGKKHTPLTPSLDLTSELPGVFWLTYFGRRYSEFFGKAKVLSLPGAESGPGDGVTIRLAHEPSVIVSEREDAEKALGELSFTGYGLIKPQGKYALTFEDLSRSS